MHNTMVRVTTNEMREKSLAFFRSKGHTIIPSASLIPENDPTVLFTTAGMHPLVPYLLGETHPGGKRLADVQKCIRTGDIDEVGDATHLTFFEMLGNWSLGDYFKKEAIEWSYEFLTSPEWLNLDKNRLAVSVFAGDSDAPFDDEAFAIWRRLGIPEPRIAKLPKKNNWWGPAGETGPCGPDTEIFYWTGDPNQVPTGFNDDHPLWVEIWNNVFMQYFKDKEGKFTPLKQKNVDTGMGLERVTAILNNTEVYSIDVFQPIIALIEKLSGKKYGESDEVTRAMRIIADHIRAATFIIGDPRGIVPSNVGQGYVLRRLIRRAVRYGKQLGIADYFAARVAEQVVAQFKTAYPELVANQGKITSELANEEKKFSVALEKGLREFSKLKQIDGKVAFDLYQSYGFPIELTVELAREHGFSVDMKMFEEEFKKHQELSRTASAGTFKGGLADNSEVVVKYHTATHLLHEALREVLGTHVEQKGSNITAERMRFDFSHPAKLTSDEVKRVEEKVNEVIKRDLPAHFEMLTVEEAKARGAIGLFEDKYAKLGNKVKVYFIGDYSKEICGGPHVGHTGAIGTFKIQKEEAVSAGVRRIRAVIS